MPTASRHKPQSIYKNVGQGARDFVRLGAILALGPAFIALSPGIPFANDGHCDPWYIFGLFYNQPQATSWFYPDRQVGRLAEVIPGYVATHIFPGVYADYALFFSYFLASAVLVFATARIYFGAYGAFVSTAFFAANPVVIASLSVTLDNPACLYCTLSLYCISRSFDLDEDSKWLLTFLAAGIAAALALNAHLVSAVYLGANYSIFMAYEIVSGRQTRRIAARIVKGVVTSCVGVVVGSIALGLTNVVIFGGAFVQIFNQIQYVPRVSHNSAEFYWKPDWYSEGSIAGILIIATGISVLTLAFLRSRMLPQSPGELHRRASALAIGVLLLTGVLVLYNSFGGVFLQYDYYYETYILYVALLVAAPIGLLGEPRHFRAPLAAIFFVAALLFAALAKSDIIPWLYRPDTVHYVAAAVAILILSAYAAWLRAAHWRFVPTVYLALLVVATLIIRPNYFGAQIWSAGDNPIGRQAYARLRTGLQFLAEMKFQSHPKFWVDTQSGPAELLAYPRSYIECTFNHFPEIDPKWWNSEPEPRWFGPKPLRPGERRFVPGDDVVVISSQPDIRSFATLAFSSLGLSVRQENETTINGGGQRYEMLVERVTSIQHAPNLATWPTGAAPPANAARVDNVFGPPGPIGGALRHAGTRILIETQKDPWAYAAVFPLRMSVRGPAWITVRERVMRGQVAIGVLDRSGRDFLARTVLDASGEFATTTLAISSRNQLGQLVVESGPGQEGGEIEIGSISALELTNRGFH